MKTAILIALLLLSLPASAAQEPVVLPTVSPYPGMTFLNNVNDAFETLQTNFSGSSAPTSPIQFQMWVDTANDLLKVWDGTNWLPAAKFADNKWVGISNGVIGTIPSTTGSTNAYILTFSPAPTGLVVGQHYPFIANFTNTGAATLNINSLGAHAITKRGVTAIGANDVSSGAVVDTIWDGTYFQMISMLGSAGVGTVTSVATTDGITGGTITTTGTVGLASVANNTTLSNVSGASAIPTASTLSTIFDSLFGSTVGAVLYRGASTWGILAAGTSGKPLLTGGAGADPSYGNAPVSALNGGTNASSSTYWRGDGVWATPTSGSTGWTVCSRTTSPCGASQALASGGCAGQQGGQNYPSGKAWVCGSGTPWVICCQ